ncbi:MAG: hypothetical protein JSV16_00010, partial [Candidatus Hydrogenedentota bacterium]
EGACALERPTAQRVVEEPLDLVVDPRQVPKGFQLSSWSPSYQRHNLFPLSSVSSGFATGCHPVAPPAKYRGSRFFIEAPVRDLLYVIRYRHNEAKDMPNLSPGFGRA